MSSFFFFFKQKTAYEMRISDWSSDVCSSDLGQVGRGARLYDIGAHLAPGADPARNCADVCGQDKAIERDEAEPPGDRCARARVGFDRNGTALRGIGKRYDQRKLGSHSRTPRSEEHTSELQSLMRISYAVFCLKKKKKKHDTHKETTCNNDR